MTSRLVYERTEQDYEALIFDDTATALAGVYFDLTMEQADHRHGVRQWGLAEFPLFQLSEERVLQAMQLGRSMRQLYEHKKDF